MHTLKVRGNSVCLDPTQPVLILLLGEFEHQGATYTFMQLADRVEYRNGNTHKTYAIPESYKPKYSICAKDATQDIQTVGNGNLLDCSPFVNGPGAKELNGKESREITCTYRFGSGNNRELIPFDVKLGKGRPPSLLLEGLSDNDYVDDFEENDVSVSGCFADENQQNVKVTYVMKQIKYRNGDSHKILTRDQGASKEAIFLDGTPGFNKSNKIRCGAIEPGGGGSGSMEGDEQVSCIYDYCCGTGTSVDVLVSESAAGC